MLFSPYEVSIPHIIYACLGGFIVLFGMFSLLLREKLYVGEACWAFLFGVIIGPYGANVFNPRDWGGGGEETTNIITLEFTRVVLAIGVFAIGVELPKAYMRWHWKSLFFFLGPVMVWGWFVSAGLIFALVPSLNFLSSLAVAACLTPTDPILAAAVVGGKWANKHVPAHLRHLLAAESGCNDGAAFPFLFIALYLLLEPDTGTAVRDWFVLLWLWQVALGILIGALLGFGFRHLMKFCQRHDLIDRHSYVAKYVSLAIFTIGVTTLLGSDDLLAAFACGTAFAWDGFFNRQTEESVFSSVIDLLFNIAAFIYVGAWMPFDKFNDEELTLTVWRLVVIAILVLLLRRLPIVIALYKWIPDIKTFREAVFSGHFGPIGIGAVFISTLATRVIHEKPGEHSHQADLVEDAIQPIVAFMVLCSITIHGLSIPSFSLGRHVHSVSRTWSRHSPPEWLNQARVVSRGATDIVVNRDRDDKMERGEIQSDEKVVVESSMRPALGTDLRDEGSSATTLEGLEQEDHPRGERARPDTPPDGIELVTEWQEPHHRVVEWRTGPGEDVNVEVVDEEDPMGSRISHLRQAFTQSLKRLEDLRKTAKGLEHEASSDIEGEIKNIGAQVEGIQNCVNEALSAEAATGTSGKRSPSASPPPRLPPPQEHVQDNDDEGWASDASDAPVSACRKKKSKPSKSKTGSRTHSSHVPGFGRWGRHPSIRRRNVQSLSHRDTSHPPGVAEERGRSPVPVSAPTTTSPQTLNRSHTPSLTNSDVRLRHSRPGTSDSVRNRLEHIRMLHSAPPTREASPSRSVWFADEVYLNARVDTARSQPPTPEKSTTELLDSAASKGV